MAKGSRTWSWKRSTWRCFTLDRNTREVIASLGERDSQVAVNRNLKGDASHDDLTKTIKATAHE